MNNISRQKWRQSVFLQQGTLLLETVILLSVFAVLGVAILGAVQTSYFAKGLFDTQSVAENILRNQLEYVYEQDYQRPGCAEDEPYAVIPREGSSYLMPPGYAVTVEALVYEDQEPHKISAIRVTVLQDSHTVRVFETLRANRSPEPCPES